MKLQFLVIFTLALVCSAETYLDNIDYTFAVNLVGQSLFVIKKSVNLALDMLPDQDYDYIKVRDIQLTKLSFGTPVIVKTNVNDAVHVAVTYNDSQFGVGAVIGSTFFLESLKSYEVTGIKIAYTMILTPGDSWLPKISIDKQSLKFDVSKASGSFKQKFDNEILKQSSESIFSKVSQWFKTKWAQIKQIWVNNKDKAVEIYHKFSEEYMFKLQKEMAIHGFLTDAVFDEINQIVAKTAQLVIVNGKQVIRLVEQQLPEIQKLPSQIIEGIVKIELEDFVKSYPDAKILKSNPALEQQQRQMLRFETEMLRRGN